NGSTTTGILDPSSWLTEADISSSPGLLNPGPNEGLPVELSSFSALINKNSVNLIWKTETEVNNYGFEIQRSIQSEDWKTLGFVNGNGNSNSPKDYSFTDNSVGTSGKYSYRLKQIDNDGSYEYSKSIEVNLGAPASIELKQNYPNPFNPSTTINFTLPVEDAVSLIVYNAIGEQVKVLYSGVLEAGVHSFNFSGDDLPSGLYVYKLSTSAGNQIRKMMLVK
ncbi:T9SS type A sorting domain-containing protein, partial [bacterium BMS3Abin03]|nr:T9SS type A sorting domain-containing protein [bacterium BMS3Abin03]